MLPYFKDKVLPVYGKDWQGLMGAPNRVPAEAEYTNLLGGGSAGLLYFGMGRFLSSISTQVPERPLPVQQSHCVIPLRTVVAIMPQQFDNCQSGCVYLPVYTVDSLLQ